MKEQLIAELESTSKEFLEVLSSFDQEEFNYIPATGVWSAAQMSDHVLQSISGFATMLLEDGTPAERPSDAMVKELKTIFLDFSTKLKSPEFILPRGEYFDQSQLIALLNNSFDDIIRAIPVVDLNEISQMKFPRLGALSKLEMVQFVIVHTTRHLHQAKKIRAAA